MLAKIWHWIRSITVRFFNFAILFWLLGTSWVNLSITFYAQLPKHDFFRIINLMMGKWGEACWDDEEARRGPKRIHFWLNFAPIKQISHFGNFPICPGGRRVYGALPTVKCTENRVGGTPLEMGPSSLVRNFQQKRLVDLLSCNYIHYV